MKRTITTLVALIILTSTATAETIYLSRSYLNSPYMIRPLQILESQGHTFTTSRRSADLTIRIKFSTHRTGRSGRNSGILGVSGGAKESHYFCFITLEDKEKNIVARSHGSSLQYRSISAPVPRFEKSKSSKRSRQSRSIIEKVLGGKVRVRTNRTTYRVERDVVKEKAAIVAIKKLVNP